MIRTNILYIGRNPEILETVVRLLNKREEWNGVGVQDDKEAMALFNGTPFDLVLFGPGISADEEAALCEYFVAKRSQVKLVQHYGGGSGLLLSEVMMALQG
ncbi:hypothetical protein MKQ68_14915 [Chitinophaga horti]|uniref:Response regulator receiver domain-containing protein n=1 Tax=Chitinophaga horti TaxID=2920382 RepID=A0ABY6IVI1_9BACT|nr:hypothetical protein [Chitinophaga horti]UYQ91383.1 hypothetical protein MKQ68_14915 [Chitinophaga horti]